MATKIYELKEKVQQAIPPNELPKTVFARLMLKTGIMWSGVNPNTEVTDAQYQKAVTAVKEIFGNKVQV